MVKAKITEEDSKQPIRELIKNGKSIKEPPPKENINKIRELDLVRVLCKK